MIDCAYISEPTVIVEPGCYEVSEGFSLNGQRFGLNIQADDVRIIGNGHCITGSGEPDTSDFGIYALGRSRVKVSDICIEGMRIGVFMQPVKGEVIEDCEVANSTITGSRFNGVRLLCESAVVHGNTVSDTGGDYINPHAFGHHIYILGDDAEITSNETENVFPVGNGEGVCFVLYGDGKIAGNSCVQDGPPAYGRIFGTWTVGEVEVSGNTFDGTDYALGPWGTLTGNIVNRTACELHYIYERPRNIPTTLEDNKQDNAGAWECRDTLEHHERMYFKGQKAEYAYGAYLSTTVDRYEMSRPLFDFTRHTWFFVSARLGHSRAVVHQANLVEAGVFTPDISECVCRLTSDSAKAGSLAEVCADLLPDGGS